MDSPFGNRGRALVKSTCAVGSVRQAAAARRACLRSFGSAAAVLHERRQRAVGVAVAPRVATVIDEDDEPAPQASPSVADPVHRAELISTRQPRSSVTSRRSGYSASVSVDGGPRSGARDPVSRCRDARPCKGCPASAATKTSFNPSSRIDLMPAARRQFICDQNAFESGSRSNEASRSAASPSVPAYAPRFGARFGEMGRMDS